MLTRASDRGATRRFTGSLSASPPATRVTAGEPPKVSVRTLPGTALDPVASTATVAWATWTAWVPKALLSRIRTWSPPAERKTTLRTVWLVSPVPAGQAEPGMSAPITGLAPQAVTQWPPAAGRAGPAGTVPARGDACAPSGMRAAPVSAATAMAAAARDSDCQRDSRGADRGRAMSFTIPESRQHFIERQGTRTHMRGAAPAGSAVRQ